MTWNPLTEPVDFVELGGRRTPGIAELMDAALLHSWDERRGYGYIGATSIYRGRRLSHFKLLIRLYTEQDWDDWEEFREVLEPPPLPDPNSVTALRRIRPRALEIVHPITEMLGIRSVTIEHVKQPVQTSAQGGEWLVEVGLLEYRRPEFRLSRPEGTEDSPTDPADQSIAQLTAIVQNDGQGDVLQALAPLNGLGEGS